MTVIPAPPELKPTIIQMQNSESTTTSPNIIPKNPDEREEQPKRRRRRSSSSFISQSEIEKRRREHKTAHSIIEKKRRVRMNREFEALKFLIPACRNSLIGSGNGTSGSTSGGTSGAGNNSGEGMYKLTILQATVDYIKYLHEVINIQQEDLNKTRGTADEKELEFAKIEIDTDSYRNVDIDFDFNKLFDDYSSNRSSLSSDSTRLKKKRITDKSKSIPMPPQEPINSNTGFQALPSPIITPELHPSTSVNSSTIKSDFQFPKPRGAFIASGSSMSSNCTSEFQIIQPQPRSSSQGSSNHSPNSDKLEIIDEFSQFKNDRVNSQIDPRTRISITGLEMDRSSNHELHLESDSANVLLSLKNDSVSSIRSLLN